MEIEGSLVLAWHDACFLRVLPLRAGATEGRELEGGRLVLTPAACAGELRGFLAQECQSAGVRLFSSPTEFLLCPGWEEAVLSHPSGGLSSLKRKVPHPPPTLASSPFCGPQAPTAEQVANGARGR